MESRKALVNHLIEYDRSIVEIIEALKVYGWDSDVELVVMKPSHIENVLNCFLSGELTKNQVRDWANAVGRREDFELDKQFRDTMGEMVFWLANPSINFPITEVLVKRVISNLQTNTVR